MFSLVWVLYCVAVTPFRLAEHLFIAEPLRRIAAAIKKDSGYLAASVYYGAMLGAAFVASQAFLPPGAASACALTLQSYALGALSAHAFVRTRPVLRKYPVALRATRAAGFVGVGLGAMPALLLMGADTGALATPALLSVPAAGFAAGVLATVAVLPLGSPARRHPHPHPGKGAATGREP